MDCELGSRFLFLYLKHEISTLRKKKLCHTNCLHSIKLSKFPFIWCSVLQVFLVWFSSFPALFSYFHKKTFKLHINKITTSIFCL